MIKLLQLVSVLVLTVLFSGCYHHRPPIGTEQKIDIPALEWQVQNSPEDVKAWIALRNGLFDTNQWDKAIKAYHRALELDPKNVNVRVDMGTCYRNVGNPGKALEEYRTAIEIDPNHKNARRNAGIVLLYDLNREAEAIVEFEKYLELMGDVPEAEQVRALVNELKAKRNKLKGVA